MDSTKIFIIFCFIAITSAANVRSRPGYAQGSSAPAQYNAPAQQYSAPAPAPVRVYQQEKEVEEEDEEPVRVTKVKLEDYSGRYRTGYPSGSANLGATRLDVDKLVEEQNQNAQYTFASAVDDGIMDQSQVRQETREGKKVSGSYSYSDGFYKRTIKYEADEDGYRVVGEDIEPIGDGPQVDLENGKADVHQQVHGVDTIYSISAQDIGQLTKQQTKVLKLKL